jgi:hypothetical protein
MVEGVGGSVISHVFPKRMNFYEFGMNDSQLSHKKNNANLVA